ncbi:MAG: hypothetical protein AMXMBFR36_30590 [Acidobacteriota bacterium]
MSDIRRDPKDDLPPTLVDGPSSTHVEPEGVAPELDPSAEDRFADPDLDAVESLGRFRIERFLGAGGMGKVFRAFDRQLERPVALKLLTLQDAEAARRFLAEARAQARVDHPNVCKVYDAGEVRGRRFIVMQLLEGETLSRAASSLTLEQKIALVADVCDGVQAAHRIGLVHRDLKASNVIVVAGEDGLHPYVVDFGLAREAGPGGRTVTGAAVGTPWYMSPEQVAGKPVDRRSDVYSLGVLLYRLISDRYPIEGSSEVDVMMRVLSEDPEPLRRAAPSVPADLETVVMKCLERDAARRYDSARALADDLGRWLSGEPVEARAAGFGYRLAKRVRKHWPLVALGAAAAAALAVGGGVAIAERVRAAERARLAQRLGAQTERLEWMLRAAHELPLHDVSPVRGEVRRRLGELEAELAGTARGLVGPIRFALGRGWLALDEAERAESELAQAWQAGFREPEVALARGLALARRFERALESARRIPNPEERAAALAEARERWERPAAELLDQGRAAAAGSGAYVAALLAFHREDWDEALAASREAIRLEPWLYEAKLLEGAIERSRAEGRSGAERDASLAAARAALDDATRRGESDPRAHAGLCSLELDHLTASLAGSAEGAEATYEAAVAACDRALVADPGYAPARRLRLEAIAGWASWAMDAGREVAEPLAAARAEAARLVEARDDDPESRLVHARVLEIEAKRLRYAGDDPRPLLEEASAALEAAAGIAPADWRTLRGHGRVAADLAIQAQERGGDPLPAFERAIASLERAVALRPDLALLHFDLGRARSDRGAFRLDRRQDGASDLAAAAADYRRALEIQPDYPQAWNSLGVTHLLAGQTLVAAGKDAAAELDAARVALERAIEIRPGYANPRFNLGLVHRSEAESARQQGRDPRPAMARAIAAFEAGLEINPGIFFAWLEMGRIGLVGARWEIDRGGSPERDLAGSRALVARALESAPDDYMALRVAGEADLIEAEWRRRGGRGDGGTLARGIATLERALAANPADRETADLLAQARALAAPATAASR